LIISKKNNITFIFCVISVLYIGLAIFGGIQHYSPVPHWDMWDGYLGFYVKALSGDWSAWWAQHNEHRIVIARLFFWMDLAWFHGTGLFLIIINYVLVALGCFTFTLAINEKTNSKTQFILFFMYSWMFYWIQNNNLTWGFQSQFILAQLLPLCAFYFLHKSRTTPNTISIKYFFLATCFGIAAMGTMANGVLALPLMTIYCMILHFGWKKTFFLAILSGALVTLYFSGYHAPSGHGSLINAVQNNFSGLIQYILLYTGGPFYYLVGKGNTGMLVAQIAGAFLIISASIFSYQSLRSPPKNTLNLALLTFILYIGGTAFGTAGGRLIFGIHQALSSRYMTPSIMAWVALLILYIPSLNKISASKNIKIWIPFFALLLLMLPYQLKALSSQDNMLFERKIGALALELGIQDQSEIAHIYPRAKRALSVAKQSGEQNLSIFGMLPIKDAKERIGSHSNAMITSTTTLGSLDGTQILQEDERYLRIRGWIFCKDSLSVPNLLEVVDNQGIVVGVALTGQPRPDVAKAINPVAVNSGFKGYLLSSQQGKTLELRGVGSNCMLKVKAPDFLLRVAKMIPTESKTTIRAEEIMPNNEWTGTDYAQSHFENMVVCGSFIRSDQDTGSISLKLRRGDSFFYRSGPTGGHQFLEIQNSTFPKTILPVAVDWSQLNFSSDRLPDEFIIKISDQGTGWGEWSSVAFKNNK